MVVISHGYPGNRFLLSHLAENLATKGYVVASIDHTDSTYNDQAKFGSTLVNRSLDQTFVLNEIDRLSKDAASFLNGIADASNAGLVGYSMGGYGAVITAGGGVTEASTKYEWGAPDGTLAIHQAGSATHEALPDPRYKAAIAFAPWGMERGFWDAEGLKGIEIPMFFVQGANEADGRAVLFDEWYPTIEAPIKDLAMLETSGHRPLWEQPEPFVDYMVDVVLARTLGTP